MRLHDECRGGRAIDQEIGIARAIARLRGGERDAFAERFGIHARVREHAVHRSEHARANPFPLRGSQCWPRCTHPLAR